MQGRINQYLKLLKKYDFNELIKNQKDPRVKIRLLAVQQISKGKRITETAQIFNIHFQSIRRWLEALKKGGIENLQIKPSSGRTRKLLETEAFKKTVLEMQKNKPGGAIRGIDILNMMEEKFGVKVCLNSVYNYLKRANLVWITGRSINPNSDLKDQISFKKNLKKS